MLNHFVLGRLIGCHTHFKTITSTGVMTENMALKIFHLNLLLSKPEWIALAIFFASGSLCYLFCPVLIYLSHLSHRCYCMKLCKKLNECTKKLISFNVIQELDASKHADSLLQPVWMVKSALLYKTTWHASVCAHYLSIGLIISVRFASTERLCAEIRRWW